VGFKGLTRLLGATGDGTVMIRSEFDLESEDLVVVALEERVDRDALSSLIARRAAKPTLLILPKWNTVPDPMKKGWVSKAGLVDTDFLGGLLEGIAELKITPTRTPQNARATGQDLLSGITLPTPALSQSISGEDVIPMLTLQGRTLLAEVGDQALYVLADPDIMNNHGLANPRTARAAVEIIRRLNSTGAKSVGFDLTLNGFSRQANVLKLIFEPPFLALTLALFVAALLAGFHGASRFGPERRPERVIAFGKAALVDNSAGVLRMAGREHRTGEAYAQLVREEAKRRVGAPALLKDDSLDAYLDRFAGPGGLSFTELANSIRAARDRHELLSAARALFQWKKDISQ
jgi:hypothetical protein